MRPDDGTIPTAQVMSANVPPDAVRAQLSRIQASGAFTDRLSRFLQYIVEQTLAGQGDSLKEYQVGVAALGRSQSYDPRLDPVVRVEARRLRSTLEVYYANRGQKDPVVIRLPKGGYVPVFEARQEIPDPAIDREETPITLPPKNISPASSRWKLVAMVVAAGAILAAGLFVALRTHPSLTDKDTVVLADFANTTGDPVFDGALRQGLSSQLEQSPFLHLLSEAQAAQTLSLMAQPKDVRFTGELARQVCERTGSKATIEGSIFRLGDQYVVGLKALDCHNGDLLAEEQATANGKEQVLGALGGAASRLREKLGESLVSVQKFDAPPENVTTASLEALQAYSVGYQVHVVNVDDAAAAALFQRAIGLDPNFAMAYARLATSYANLGESARAAEAMRKAYELRNRVSEHERLFILSLYEELVTGNLEAARKAYELRAQLYPHDDIAIGNLGNIYFSLGQYDKALTATKEALKRNPGSRIWYANLVNAFIGLNQLDKAKATAQEAYARKLEGPWLHVYLYLIGFLQQDSAGMDREAATLAGRPGYEDVVLYYQSEAAAYAGQLGKARELTRRATESAQRVEEKESAATYVAEAAAREALAGNAALARGQANAALALDHSRDVVAMAAIALGLTGDAAAATRLANDLAKRFPEDTLVRSYFLPMIRATAALHGGGAGGNAQKAIDELAVTAPFELGSQSMIRVAFSAGYPAYLRGEAYLAARQGALAAVEFQKIVDHPGAVLAEPIGALAHLGLARAYALSGDHASSRIAYLEFLRLWKNADSDLPVLQQAKSEYARLP